MYYKIIKFFNFYRNRELARYEKKSISIKRYNQFCDIAHFVEEANSDREREKSRKYRKFEFLIKELFFIIFRLIQLPFRSLKHFVYRDSYEYECCDGPIRGTRDYLFPTHLLCNASESDITMLRVRMT